MTLDLQYTTILDVVLILYLLWQIYLGYSKGFMDRMLSFGSLLIALLGAWWVSQLIAAQWMLLPNAWFADALVLQLFQPWLNTAVWFVILFAVFRIALLVLKPLVNAVASLPIIKQLNTLAGVVLALLTSLLVAIVLCVICKTPIVENGYQVIESSVLRFVDPVADLSLSLLDVDSTGYEALQRVMMKEASQVDVSVATQVLLDLHLSPEQVSEFLAKRGY
ncbi:MAG: CvpA family protein [Erysipelotrichaceae bacterium]